MNQKRFENILIFGCVGASMFSPWAAAFALLILLSGQAAERFLTRNLSDADRDQIGQLKIELTKHTEILQKQGLAQAFGGKK